MVSVLTEGRHVGYSREYITCTVCCTYGHWDTTNESRFVITEHTRIPSIPKEGRESRGSLALFAANPSLEILWSAYQSYPASLVEYNE